MSYVFIELDNALIIYQWIRRINWEEICPMNSILQVISQDLARFSKIEIHIEDFAITCMWIKDLRLSKIYMQDHARSTFYKI